MTVDRGERCRLVVSAGATRSPDERGRYGAFATRRVALLVTGVLAVLVSVLVSGGALAAPNQVLWQSQVDLGSGLNDQASAVAIAGGTVFAVGQGAPNGRDWLVRAYDAASGAVRWTDQHRGAPPPATFRDTAIAVAAQGGRAFAAGFVRSPTSRDWFVRAYNAHNGAIVWQDQLDLGGNDEAQATVVHGNRLFVAGFGGPACAPGPSNCDFLVRAYDAASGAVRWTQRIDNNSGDDRAFALAVENDRVYAIGGLGNGASPPDWTIRAFDAQSGAPLWHREEGTPGDFEVAQSIAVDRGRVFVSGSGGGCGAPACVRAYDGRTGAPLWTKPVGPFEALSLAAEGGRVYTAGFDPTSGVPIWLVRAYDASNGTLVWEDSVTPGFAGRVAVHGSQVVAAGGGGPNCGVGGPTDCDVLVRVLDKKDGKLEWQDLLAGPIGDDQVNGLAVEGNLIAIGGFVFKNPGDLDFFVRAYRAH
jgi:hypothetical protein